MKIFTSMPKMATAIFLLFFLNSTTGSAQLIAWDAANGGSGFGSSPLAPAILDTNITMVAGLSRGASITTSGTAAGGCWGGSGGWGTTDATSVYFVFQADAGTTVSLTSITGATRRAGGGPTTCNVEYSINGGAYSLAGTWSNTVTTGTVGSPNSTTLSGITALQNVAAGTPIRFRIVFPTTGTNWYITNGTNSLRVNGTVSAVNLAIDLKNISAVRTSNYNSIVWNTAHEDQGDYFELEKSTDAVRFAKIATINAKGSNSSYSYADRQIAANATTYYRLKMVDAAGITTYSKVVSANATITQEATAQVAVFPNPLTTHILHLQTTADSQTGNATVSIWDITGKKVLEQSVNESMTVDTHSLPAGQYLLRYTAGNNSSVTRFVK